jgi:Nop53 (60S ribosomal biogenesis)
MSKRILKRSAQAGEMFTAAVVLEAEAHAVTFVEDRVGSISKRRKLKDEATRGTLAVVDATGKVVKSKAETVVYKKAIKNLSSKALSVSQQPPQSLDLWDDNCDELALSATAASSAKKSFGKCSSYNPSFDAHQTALAEALALEIKKREEDEREAAKGLRSVPVVQYEMDEVSSEEESEVSGDDVDGENKNKRKLSRRRGAKLTRAQRNKMRARKIADHHASIANVDKQILKDINSIPSIIRDIDAEEKHCVAELELKKLLKEESLAADNMTYEEAGIVPLSDELTGSLRTLLPKGVLVKSLESDMRKSGKLMEARRRARRKDEHPHGAKNIRWIDKYKYT